MVSSLRLGGVALWDKVQRQAVIAVTLASRLGAIIEQMTLMAAATTAMVFCSGHQQRVIDFSLDMAANQIIITATVRTNGGQAGVSMEAMTAVSVAALTIYDMAKGRDRGMTIANIQLQEKRGGHTGDWQRSG